jgi:hypothetical protein
MNHGGIYNTIRGRTRDALGFPVNLHQFRRAAPTLWSSRDPANVRGSKDLIGHTTFDTTEKYYIMAQSRVAGRVLARAIEGKRKGCSRPFRVATRPPFAPGVTCQNRRHCSHLISGVEAADLILRLGPVYITLSRGRWRRD